MGIITKIALRNMKRRKIRYILTTVTLVIGVALFGGVMIASDSFYNMMLSSMNQQMGTADILVRSDKTDEGWFDQDEINDTLKDIDHIKFISYRISGFSVFVSGTIYGNQIDNSTNSAVYGLDINNKNEQELGGTPYILDAIKDVEDATNIEGLLDYKDDQTGSRVVVIIESLKIKLGKDINAGDTIQILPREGENLGYDLKDTGTWLTYTITAIIRDSGEAKDFDPKDPSESTTPSQRGPLIFTDNEKTTHELVDGTVNHEGEVNLCAIGLDDIHNANITTEEISKKLKELKGGKDWKESDLKTNTLERIDTTMTTMRAMFSMFGLIALILSIVLIMNIFNIIREEQEYETGMFQAIGASKSETFRMFITQGVVMGIIGSVIGTILSYFISYWIFSSVVNTLSQMTENLGTGFVPSEFEIILLPATLIMTFAVGFVSCLLASIYPSYKASKKPLIECLNPIEEKSEREKKKYAKKAIYAILGTFLIIISALFIFDVITVGGNGGGPPGMGGNATESTIAMTAPTFMLLGIVIISALFVRPLSKGIVKMFSPYLKQTKLLTEKNILRHRKRTVLTFSMIALTVSYLVGMSVMMDSMREGVNTTVDDFMGSDARVFAFGTPRSLENDLLGIDGVDDVMGIRYQNAMVKVNGKWIGHSMLETDYDTAINFNVIDTKKVEKHMSTTTIISPSGMTLEEMMKELESGKNVVITEDFANEYKVEVGDKLPVKFSLGITYSSIQAMMSQNSTDSQEDTITVEMKVVAIVKKIQGFFTGSISFSGSGVTVYPMFISWDIYDEEIAPNELPGKGTDLVYRQMTQTGNLMLDAVQSNWFNFSTIEAIMNGISGIDYYTSRMDYSTLTFNGAGININTPVVGIHTMSNGKFRSDSDFGSNSFGEKNATYTGSTMEELLNNTDNVCVVDQIFVNNQRSNGNPTFGINSLVSILPYDTDPTPVLLRVGDLNTTIDIGNGSLIEGNIANLTVSDNVNITYVSHNKDLLLNFNFSMLNYLTVSPKPINLTIESNTNASINKIELRALNLYTNQYDKLGDINKTVEYNYTFSFNPNGSYVNITTGILKLRIIGQNATAGANYSLSIDSLNVLITQSKFNASNPLSWPTFRVVGIINSPKLYETERYTWYAGIEAGADASGNVVYINYNKSRTLIYPDYKGKDISNDKVSSVLVHCDDPQNIASIKNTLSQTLFVSAGGLWSIVDLKSFALELRKSAFDWYFWFKSGVDEDTVLQDIQIYIQDRGYLVLFGFTRTFMISTFISMIDLMTFITYGMLILAIIISLIGLALHSLLTTMSRKREIGMLRSIGLSKKGIVRSISGETLIISLLGVLIGIFAGLIQGILMVTSMPAGGFLATTLVIPWLTIVILVLITVVVAIASSMFPARWAANLNIIDAVRTR